LYQQRSGHAQRKRVRRRANSSATATATALQKNLLMVSVKCSNYCEYWSHHQIPLATTLIYIYIFIHQKMIATKQIRKNEKLDSGHNIENTITYTPT